MTVWTLAIETVATAGSVALLCDDRLHAERDLPPDARSARTLASAVHDLWQQAGKPQVSLVAVARGPGSFTGLRVGVTTAKTLAYAWGAKLLGVHTLDAIAAQAATTPASSLHVVLDAQRQELFVAKFESLENEWRRIGPDAIIASQDWLTSLESSTQVTGPALTKLRDRLADSVLITPAQHWHPRAAIVAKLARKVNQAGQADELWTLMPDYLRVSYAEEKRPV